MREGNGLVMFHEAERWTNGIYDCFEIQDDGLHPISQAECQEFILRPEVKNYGKNDKGYILCGV